MDRCFCGGSSWNGCYATGKWPYDRRNSRAGPLPGPASIVEIDMAPIIRLDLFERVQDKRTSHNPRVTPPRIVNGPTLLTGLAFCADCGSGITGTGARSRDRIYTC